GCGPPRSSPSSRSTNPSRDDRPVRAPASRRRQAARGRRCATSLSSFVAPCGLCRWSAAGLYHRRRHGLYLFRTQEGPASGRLAGDNANPDQELGVPMLVDLVIVFGLILLNGLFAMSELAVVSSRKSRLQSLARRGVRGARTALKLAEEPTAFLSTVQIGITLVGILAGAFSGVALGEEVADWLGRWQPIAPYADPIAIGTIVVAITYVTLIVGELVPKRVALRRPERIAVVVAPPMQTLSRIAGPLVFVLKHSTEGVMRLLHLGGGQESPVTEEEVRMLIAEGTRAGVFLATEREMIEGVLRLADRRVRAIMTPRQEVVWLDVDAPPEEIAETLAEHHMPRYPVCRETIDNPVGVVDVNDIAAALLKGKSVRLADLIVPPLVVPEGVYVLNLLEMFRTEGAQMAI